MSGEELVVVGDVSVLVVGDSDRTEAARTALEAAVPGPTVLTARTLADALERLDERDVHCVVCDLESESSPLEPIHSQVADVPIVAITEESAAEAALEAGAADVLSPAAPPAVAASRVKNVVERHRRPSRSAAERYRRVLEAADAPIVVLSDDGEVQYASPALETETGVTPAELERRPLSRYVHPDDREEAGELLSEVVAGSLGTTGRGRYRFRHADGTWTVHEVTVTNRLEDPAIAGIVVTVSPARAAASAADPVSRAADRLEGAFLSLGRQWEIVHANEAASRLLIGDDSTDARPDALTGTVIWDRLPESVRGTFYERLNEARASESLVTFDVEYPPIESWLAVEAHPSESGLTMYAREATVADGVEDRRERLSLFESVIDALEDGVLVLEGTTVELANAAAFDLLGADVIVGRDLTALVDAPLAESIRERADSPVVRRAEPIRATLHPDEPSDREPTPVAVSVVPLLGDDRVVCVVRDETDRRDLWDALTSVRETGSALLEAGTNLEVTQTTVDAAVDGLGTDFVGCYLRDDAVLEPAAYATADDASLPPLPTFGIDETALGDAVDAAGASVRDGTDLERVLSAIGVRADRVLIAPLDGRGVVFATVTDPERLDERAVAFLESLAAMAAVALGRVEGEAAVRERERDLERQLGRFDRLAELGDRKRAIGRRLVRADDRETVEASVCEELASIDWLSLVWIGEVDVIEDTITPRAVAGDETYLESVTVDVDPDAREPAGRTAATREPAVVENVVHEERDGTWRQEALERGIGSILSVPLSYDEYVYGALTVYADRPAAFDEVTQAVLVDLGETIAYVINAIETRRALLVDGVTELELLTTAPDDPLATLARRAACTLVIGTVVPRSAEQSTIFVTVPDASTAVVSDVAADLEAIDSVQPVSADDEESPLELTVVGSTIASTLVDHGGVLRSVAAAGDRVTLIVEVPQGSDVRSFVRRLGERYPRTELVARRERERPVRTRQGFRTELREELTDRQRRALEAAYYGGFFEWPRERTGEEVARSLGVSQPTFNRHYRAAERKLFTLLFDERPVDDDSST
ncbi:bacterio-opsin activator domain-containing protein [Natronobeatus ordinarius]|uniref:bacterio-opsin activator domain-containing protein n=1 Tax=Natronobeatus ordinarius TaxID=2963433 RepID=UPI0020CFB109|nr:bacterio-opsin activator domain-containing protein [Natronobeatus ordinarius]